MRCFYGWRCRIPIFWGEVGQKEVGGTEVVLEMNQNIYVIRARLKAAQHRQKSFADKRSRLVDFNGGDMVMLKFLIVWSYPKSLRESITHSISYLRKCLADDSMWVPLNEINLNNKLVYVEEPIAIIDEKVKVIQNMKIRKYKVQ
ncbi:uncharacterized protein [Rutidosis leptorrhynchoides]|uniref:uncharacterized protein n=1 Tax=Rutidosis leptorrhynchoides TaxID=125765 RepID=UPI003A99A415